MIAPLYRESKPPPRGMFLIQKPQKTAAKSAHERNVTAVSGRAPRAQDEQREHHQCLQYEEHRKWPEGLYDFGQPHISHRGGARGSWGMLI